MPQLLDIFHLEIEFSPNKVTPDSRDIFHINLNFSHTICRHDT
jgi:hypothetical protein